MQTGDDKRKERILLILFFFFYAVGMWFKRVFDPHDWFIDVGIELTRQGWLSFVLQNWNKKTVYSWRKS